MTVIDFFKRPIKEVKQAISKLSFAHKGTNLAYKISDTPEVYNNHKSDLTIDLAKTGAGWEVLCDSSRNTNTSQYDYKAVAFVNYSAKEVHIASAGTKLTEKYDLIDDALIGFLGRVPYKIDPAKAMVDQVVKLLGVQDVENYTFSTSGHSLGAIISDLMAVDIISRNLPFDKSTTFDNPGSALVVKRAIATNVFTNKVETSLEELATHCEVYNAKPNFINNINEQFGNTKLVIPKDSPTTGDSNKIEIESSGIFSYASYLFSKVGAVINTCSDYLRITSVMKQIEDHRMQNFNDIESAIVVDTDKWQKADGKLVVEKFTGYDKVTSTGNDVVVFDTNEYDSIMHISKNEYSFNDISRAINYSGEQGCGDLLGNDSFLETGFDTIM